MKNPLIYIDTNVIIDCIEKRCPHSINALNIIKKEKWPVVTSAFLVLELADTLKEQEFIKEKIRQKMPIQKILQQRSQPDLTWKNFSKIKNKVKYHWDNKYSFVEYYDLSPEGWDAAGDMCMDSNMWGGDIIHLATAKEIGAKIIITNDTFFIKEGLEFLKRKKLWSSLRICLPQEMIRNLTEMGFKT